MIDQKRQKGFVKGAVILMLFGMLSKFVGAIYRIPLTAIISAEGMGIYQMVFPLYQSMWYEVTDTYLVSVLRYNP